MSMTPEQQAAFELGAGYSADQVSLLISGVGAALIFLFLGWVLFSAYQGWADKSLSMKQLGITLFRIALLLFVTLVILTV